MDTVTLNIIFENEDGMKAYVKLNDIRADVTTSEVLVLANKLIDESILISRGKNVVKYIGTEKIFKELLV
ncbi:MAG: DUF2922 domain-containing protein [Oscillospiraceae bacterium]|nr:DUF2922 domain-containing protein [Oscillospiraceae bacterium]